MKVEVSESIARPPADVFRFVATNHVENHPRWDPTMNNRSDTRNLLLETLRYNRRLMAEWSFLTNHARVLMCIAHDPGVRLRDIATTLGITERSAYGIVTDLTAGGYVVKDKDGRRNRYTIQPDLPVRAGIGRERTIGEMLDLLIGTKARRRGRRTR